jgi:hypothetical protein
MSAFVDHCDHCCSCRGEQPTLPLSPGDPGYDEAVMRALDLAVSAHTTQERAS